MRYFTRWNVKEGCWPDVVDAYRRNYALIEAQLPLSVQEFARISLHDGRLKSYSVSDESKLILQLEVSAYVEQGLYELTFSGVRSKWGLDSVVGREWLYEEIDLHIDAAFELRVLFDEGEIAVVADELVIDRIDDRPARVVISGPRLNLVVVRSEDIDKSAAFYGLLGIRLGKHSHGDGPLHYASQDFGTVFEIYPKTEKSGSTRAARLGFAVDDLDLVLERIAAEGYAIISPPADSEWGRRAVVRDPDGHRVELTRG